MITNMLMFLYAYLVGSIPTGYIFARFMGVRDIRNQGSGSTGATNAARLLGVSSFFIIFFCDAIKAFTCILVLRWVSADFITIFGASLFLLIGNAYPIFLQFRGGKGVATAAGIMAFFNAQFFFCSAFFWTLLLAYFRRVGFASVLINTGVSAISLIWFFYGGPHYLLIFMVVSLVSLWLHKKHILDLYMNVFGGSVL